jgi:hypothetical protein
MSFLYFFSSVTKRVTPLCDSSLVARGRIDNKTDHQLNEQNDEKATSQFETKQKSRERLLN